MSTTKKLTKKFVEGILPHEKNELLLWDSELKGFGIRVFPTSRRTYFVQYRNQFGNTRRKKIGVHGAITAEQAREEAKKILGDVAKGEDPSRNFQKEKSKPTIDQLAEKYLEVYAKTNKRENSYQEDKRILTTIILKHFSGKKLEEMTPYDVQYMHHNMSKTPYMANRMLALLSKMFSLAIQWQWISISPTEGIKKFQEEKRDRWLNREELQTIWSVLDQYPYHSTAYVLKLLILTGARKGEALQATWDQFDLKKRIWTKPSHLTKQKKKEHLPLSEKTIELLEEIKKFRVPDSTYLFPGQVKGAPLKAINKFWMKIVKKSGLDSARIHDLRHTYASHLVSSGLSLSIVGKLLGHTQTSTTQRYAHLADEPLREATELFSNKIGKFISDLSAKL